MSPTTHPSGSAIDARLLVNLERVSRVGNVAWVVMLFGSALLGHTVSFYFHFLTVALLLLTVVNLDWLYVQRSHALLSNFGFLAQARYLMESVGPEFRQYWFSSDTEERPFSRNERAEVYRKAKGIDSSAAFGSQMDFNHQEIKLRHSFFPAHKETLHPECEDPASTVAFIRRVQEVCGVPVGIKFCLGCIQALQCNQNTFPVGITTHGSHLQRGLDVEVKSERVKNHVLALCHDHLSVLGIDRTHALLLPTVLLSSGALLMMRRHEIPLIGKTLVGEKAH